MVDADIICITKEITAKGFVDTEITFGLNTQDSDILGIVTDDDFKISLSDDLKTKYSFSSEADFYEIEVKIGVNSDLTVTFILRIDYYNEDDTRAKDDMIQHIDAGRYEFVYRGGHLTSVAGTFNSTKDWKEKWYHMVHSITVMLLVSLLALAMFLVATSYLWLTRRKKKTDRTIHEYTAENTMRLSKTNAQYDLKNGEEKTSASQINEPT